MTVKGCAAVGKHRTWHNHVDHVVAKTCLFFRFLFFCFWGLSTPERESWPLIKLTLYLHPSNMVIKIKKKKLWCSSYGDSEASFSSMTRWFLSEACSFLPCLQPSHWLFFFFFSSSHSLLTSATSISAGHCRLRHWVSIRFDRPSREDRVTPGQISGLFQGPIERQRSSQSAVNIGFKRGCFLEIRTVC